MAQGPVRREDPPDRHAHGQPAAARSRRARSHPQPWPRDITVVLCGSYADEFGVYERGDLAFADPGMRHQPRAVGNAPCVCLIATEVGRPLLGFFGLFGVGVTKHRDAT